MHLSVRAFALTAATVGAVSMLITCVLAMLIPSWGQPLMNFVAVVAPGVTGANWRSTVLIVLYAVIDGLVFGMLFAWLYNRFARSSRSGVT